MHLDASNVPSFDSPPTSAASTDLGDGPVTFQSQEIECASTVIWGFKKVFYDNRCFDLAGGCRKFSPILMSSWFGVYRWIEYFYQTIIEFDLGNDDFKLSFVDGSIHLFAFFSWIDNVRDVLAETPGAMRLLTRLWLRHHKLPKANPYETTILMNVIREGNKRDIDEMAETLEGGALELVQEIIEPYRQFLASPSGILEDRILSLLPIFGHFSVRPKNSLCRELLINNGVRELVRSYLRCVTNPMSSRSHKYIVHASTVVFKFFGELWRSTPGYTWVVQAFKAGLLELFMHCWGFLPILTGDYAEIILDGFLDFSMRYLAVLPVLQTALAAIREVRGKLDTETRMKLAPLKVATAWRKFEDTVNDLERIAGNLTDYRLEKYESICDFVSFPYPLWCDIIVCLTFRSASGLQRTLRNSTLR